MKQSIDGVRVSGAEALRRAGIQPIVLASKEGISLVNGTQAMLSVGGLQLLDAEALAESADLICAMTIDGLRGTPRAFDPRIHQTRPHPGQIQSAANLSRYLEGSEIRQSHITCRRVQDAYSLRCAPQVHGAVRDALSTARRAFEIELNSVTDNPLVIGDEIFSGGNFHGEPLALQLDAMAIALTVLSGISERRIDRLVNPSLNEELPPFLANHAGLESGFMMVQVTAAALVAENRVLAHPASTGSINTSRDGFRVAMDVSVYSLIAVSRGAAPLMTDGGSIMTMTYYAAEKVVPNYNVMALAKAALESATRYLAANLGPEEYSRERHLRRAHQDPGRARHRRPERDDEGAHGARAAASQRGSA